MLSDENVCCKTCCLILLNTVSNAAATVRRRLGIMGRHSFVGPVIVADALAAAPAATAPA